MKTIKVTTVYVMERSSGNILFFGDNREFWEGEWDKYWKQDFKSGFKSYDEVGFLRENNFNLKQVCSFDSFVFELIENDYPQK